MMFKCEYSLIRNKLWRNCKMCLLAKPTNRHSLWKCICPSIRVVVYGFKNTTRSEYNESRTWLDWKFEKLWSNKSLDKLCHLGPIHYTNSSPVEQALANTRYGKRKTYEAIFPFPEKAISPPRTSNHQVPTDKWYPKP